MDFRSPNSWYLAFTVHTESLELDENEWTREENSTLSISSPTKTGVQHLLVLPPIHQNAGGREISAKQSEDANPPFLQPPLRAQNLNIVWRSLWEDCQRWWAPTCRRRRAPGPCCAAASPAPRPCRRAAGSAAACTAPDHHPSGTCQQNAVVSAR